MTSIGDKGKFRIWILLLVLIGVSVSCSPGSQQEPGQETGPEVLDERLQLTLFAEDPDIMTPIGIAVDSLNRIFVLESHTHLEPSDYEGPDSDRIKLMKDENGDGKPDTISIFAEGFEKGMNITISPDGDLYLVTAESVWVIRDRDGDGKAEDRQKLIEVTRPDYVYAHAGLMGIRFSHDGWMYISRGNVGGAGWQLIGTDSSTVAGYGDGGNIIRARPDGTDLQEVATGFWNPFDMAFDDYGRLLATDNDPDSRGPNRLVHIIQGGDYGYKSLYGNSGIHPYLAWNGELPGTLPYAAGLGEAPSGLLNTSHSSLPEDYKGEMITSIWEESRIVRTDLSARGASVSGTTETIIQGGKQFRPVSFAADTSGSIYVTDWVIREYPNHGRGRIWKLEVNSDEISTTPRKRYEEPLPSPAQQTLQEIYSSTYEDFEMLQNHLASEDPFIRNAAIAVLSQPKFQSLLAEATNSKDANIRLGAMIALHRSGYNDAPQITQRLLEDENSDIRQYALKWIGRESMTSLRSETDKALRGAQVSEELFKTYLATVRHLQSAFVEAYQNQTKGESKAIERILPDGFIEEFINDQSRSPQLRAMAIKYLENPRQNVGLLTSLLAEDQHFQLRLEAVRTLAMTTSEKAVEPLLNIIKEPENTSQIRAEALAALERQAADVSAQIIPFLNDSELDIQIEAARYLRTKLKSDGVRLALVEQYKSTDHDPLKQQIALALDDDLENKGPDRPSTVEEWQSVLAEKGNARRGRRVFYSVHSTCSTCHAVKERGGDLGPQLTNVGQSKSRKQVLHSILRPSEEISPQWQGWYIQLKDGTTQAGRQINVGYDDIEIYTQAGEVVNFDKENIQDYGVSETSLMPAGLEAQLSVSDMRDLVAYLESKK